jgi:hypothetical protein
MADKKYLVSCKTPEIRTQSIIAASCEVYNEHLVLLDAKGELAAMFLLEIVDSWSVTHMSKRPRERFSERAERGDQNKLSSQTSHRGRCDGN